MSQLVPHRSMSRRHLLGAGAALAALSGAAACGRSGRVSESEGLTLMMLGADQRMSSTLEDDVLPAFTEATGIEVTLQSTDWGNGTCSWPRYS